MTWRNELDIIVEGIPFVVDVDDRSVWLRLPDGTDIDCTVALEHREEVREVLDNELEATNGH